MEKDKLRCRCASECCEHQADSAIAGNIIFNAATLPPQPDNSKHIYNYTFTPVELLRALNIILGNNASVLATALPNGKVQFTVTVLEHADDS